MYGVPYTASAWSIRLAVVRPQGFGCAALVSAALAAHWVPAIGPVDPIANCSAEWRRSNLFADPFLIPDFSASRLYLFFEV